MSTDTRNIAKLATDGSNWVMYRDRMTLTFRSRQWTQHFTSTTTPTTYTGVINGLSPDQRWNIEEDMAVDLIASTVPDQIFLRVKSHTTTMDMWNAIKAIFETRSEMASIDLRQKLQSIRMSDEGDARAHMTHLIDIREQLAALGATLTDKEFAGILLGSLPPSYRSVMQAITAAADQMGTPITSDRVIRLVNDEYDNRARYKNNSNDEAFAANTQKRRNMRDVECYNCHKLGHVRSDCRGKGGGKEGQRPPRRNDNGNNDGRSNRSQNTRGDNRSQHNNRTNDNRNNDNRNSDNRNDSANAAEPDIGAWAAIEEIEDDEFYTESVYTTAPTTRQPGAEIELYDSGASRHMSPFRHRFRNFHSIPPRAITAADHRTFYATGTGDLQIDVPNGDTTTPIILRDTLYAPDMALTIISISRINSAGYDVNFNSKSRSCKIINPAGTQVGSIPANEHGLFRVEHAYAADTAPVERIDILTLHQRLGHISANAIRALVRNHAIEGIELIDNGSPFICDSCEYAKLTRKVILKERQAPPAKRFGDEIHTDLWGPSPINSLGGRRYYITFTDDATRYTVVNVLRTKDEALNTYKTFAAWAQTQHGVKIKALRSDRGGEYTGHEFTKYLQQEGTERRLTTHDTPQHNGIAESLNRRLLERVRAILHHSELPKNLWAEALRNAVWLKNRSSTKALPNNITPYEKLYGTKPNLSGIPVWGQSIWVHSGTGSKLDARGLEARWIGFDADSTHAHRVYWPEKRSISVERNIKFNVPNHIVYPYNYPRPSPLQILAPPQPPLPAAPPVPPQAPQMATQPPVPPPMPPRQSTPGPSQPPATQAQTAPSFSLSPPLSRASSRSPAMPGAMQPEEPDRPRPPPQHPTRRRGAPPQEPTRRSTRTAIPSAKERAIQRGEATAGEEYDTPPSAAALRWMHPDTPHHYDIGAYANDFISCDYAYLADSEFLFEASTSEIQDDPKSLKQAQSRPDWSDWKSAMNREITTLERAGTWTTVPRPTNKNIVGSKWVFRIKRKADGTIEKYKARLVAQGFTQKFGVDYFDTFSPVAKLSSFRIILAIAARNDWDADTFDFNGAYLNGELDEDEDIYMKPPPGYDSEGEQVKHLHKSLYGLKQAGRKWYDTLCRALTDLGFAINDADPGVFFARNDLHVTILAIHVDDCLITGSSADLISDYKRKLNDRYSLTDLGPVHWLLGIKITRDREARTISLSQTTYVDTILSRFSLSDAKPLASPISPGIILSKTDAPSDATEMAQMKKIPYREAVGSLMYAAVATRPDITFAISTLSQFLENPGLIHWEAVKRVLRYLSGSKTFALTYGNERHDLLGYTDADGASQDHRHAISGFAFLIDGAAVSWASRKQELVTLSTAEAEYVATTHAAKECIWLRRLTSQLFDPITTSTTLYCDNQAAIHLATDDNYHARTKHIDIRFHFIRQTITDGAINIVYCPTQDMTADILTKALPKHKVAIHSQNLGICRT